jgi:hypothetical protein
MDVLAEEAGEAVRQTIKMDVAREHADGQQLPIT